MSSHMAEYDFNVVMAAAAVLVLYSPNETMVYKTIPDIFSELQIYISCLQRINNFDLDHLKYAMSETLIRGYFKEKGVIFDRKQDAHLRKIENIPDGRKLLGVTYQLQFPHGYKSEYERLEHGTFVKHGNSNACMKIKLEPDKTKVEMVLNFTESIQLKLLQHLNYSASSPLREIVQVPSTKPPKTPTKRSASPNLSVNDSNHDSKKKGKCVKDLDNLKRQFSEVYAGSEEAKRECEEYVKYLVTQVFENTKKELEEEAKKAIIEDIGHKRMRVLQKEMCNECTSDYYEDHKLTSWQERCEKIQESNPSLFSIIFACLSSDKFEKRVISNVHSTETISAAFTKLSPSRKVKENSPINARSVYVEATGGKATSATGAKVYILEKKGEEAQLLSQTDEIRQRATFLCELILNMRLNRSGFTPTALEVGLVAGLCGMTQQGQDILTDMGLSAGRSTVRKVIRYFSTMYECDVINTIEEAKCDPNKRLIVILDNWNVLRWLKRITCDQDFTRNIASLSVLIKAVPYDNIHEGDDGVSAFDPINFSWLSQQLSDDSDEFLVPREFKDYIDTTCAHQSLCTFKPHKSLPKKSSSEVDILSVIRDFLIQLCGLDEKEVFVVLDPEILLLFSKIAHAQPELMKNIVFLPAIFHIRKHNIENIANDPAHLLLFFLPFYYDCLGLQCNKKKEMSKQLLQSMRNKVHKTTQYQQENHQELENDKGSNLNDRKVRRTTAKKTKRDSCSKLESIKADQKRLDEFCHEDNGDSDDELDQVDIDGEGLMVNVDNAKKDTDHDLFDDAELEELVIMINRYSRFGLRLGDLSYRELMGRKINYARQFFIFQQIHHIFEENKEEFRQIVTQSQSWAAEFVFDMLDKGVGDLCMTPFKDIILRGSANKFLKTFPKMIKLMAHYGRDKVARSYVVLQSSFNHYSSRRKDILGTYMKSCVSSNDNHVENYNGLLSTALPTNSVIEFTDIERCSTLVQVKRELLKSLKNRGLVLSGGEVDIVHEGEILKEERKHLSTIARKDHSRILEFLHQWFSALSKTSVKTTAPLVAHSSTNHKLDSIEDLLRHGKDRVITDILPAYEKYIRKVQRESKADQEDAEGYKTYLEDSFTIAMLKCAAALAPRGLSQEEESKLDSLNLGDAKSYWVELISRLYCRRDVNEVMIRNNISTQTAEDFLRNIKVTKQSLRKRHEQERKEDREEEKCDDDEIQVNFAL